MITDLHDDVMRTINQPVDNFYKSAADYEREILQCIRDNPDIEVGMMVMAYDSPEMELFIGYGRVLECFWCDYYFGHYCRVQMFDGRQINGIRATHLKRAVLKRSMTASILQEIPGGYHD